MSDDPQIENSSERLLLTVPDEDRRPRSSSFTEESEDPMRSQRSETFMEEDPLGLHRTISGDLSHVNVEDSDAESDASPSAPPPGEMKVDTLNEQELEFSTRLSSVVTFSGVDEIRRLMEDYRWTGLVVGISISNQTKTTWEVVSTQLFYGRVQRECFPTIAANQEGFLIATRSTPWPTGTSGVVILKNRETGASIYLLWSVPYSKLLFSYSLAVGETRGGSRMPRSRFRSIVLWNAKGARWRGKAIFCTGKSPTWVTSHQLTQQPFIVGGCFQDLSEYCRISYEINSV